MSEHAEAGAHEDVDPRLGTLIDGRYRLLRRLGAGGFGVVYEAEHEVIKRRVAVKMLHASFAAEPEVLARFRREAIAATSIGHPHIVEVLDMGRAGDGAAYMVLELLEGRDWASLQDAEGPQPVGRTIRILLQVLDGLAAAHDKGIVHRDLKAENVFLVSRDGAPDFVKIVDFGISKIMEEGGGTDVVLTRTGTAMGTPVAMSPEQLQGRKDVDHRSDLWAVGVMLHHALSGAWPFIGETYAMLAVNVMTAAPPSLATLRPELPPEIDRIVVRLLEKLREKRFASAREVRKALAPFAADLVAAPEPVPPPQESEPSVDTRHDIEPPIDLALAATNVHEASELRPVPVDLDEAPAPITPMPALAPLPAPLSAPAPALVPAPVPMPVPAPSARSAAPTAILALAVGGLLVGGTWWIASSRDDAPPARVEVITPPAVASDASRPIEGLPDAFVPEDDASAVRPRRDPGTTTRRRDEVPDAGETAAVPPTTSEPTSPPPVTTTIGPVTIETPPTTRGSLRRPH